MWIKTSIDKENEIIKSRHQIIVNSTYMTSLRVWSTLPVEELPEGSAVGIASTPHPDIFLQTEVLHLVLHSEDRKPSMNIKRKSTRFFHSLDRGWMENLPFLFFFYPFTLFFSPHVFLILPPSVMFCVLLWAMWHFCDIITRWECHN